MMKIEVKYFEKTLSKIQKIDKGDWIDLRNAYYKEHIYNGHGEQINGVFIKKNTHKIISLGVGIKLPKGYEAYIVPRSSLFKKYGVLFTNSVGIIDNSYCGDNDEWKADLYATKDVFIPFDERICQFRIIENQPLFEIVEVDRLDEKSRGGFGSTDFMNFYEPCTKIEDVESYFNKECQYLDEKTVWRGTVISASYNENSTLIISFELNDGRIINLDSMSCFYHCTCNDHRFGKIMNK